MGHGTEQHKNINSGTGCYKGHEPGTGYGKGYNHGGKQCSEHDHGTEHHKAHCSENNNKESVDEDLVEENFAAITTTVASLNTTMEMLVQKIASMAHHIVAMEEILTEIISENGLSLATVNARIRARIAAGTDNQGDSTMAIDAAASIASVPTR